MTTSSNKIKEARLKAGLTQKAAAKYLDAATHLPRLGIRF